MIVLQYVIEKKGVWSQLDILRSGHDPVAGFCEVADGKQIKAYDMGLFYLIAFV